MCKSWIAASLQSVNDKFKFSGQRRRPDIVELQTTDLFLRRQSWETLSYFDTRNGDGLSSTEFVWRICKG